MSRQQTQRESLRGQTVAVLGAGRSGRAAAALALRLGARVRLVDERADAAPLEGAECVFGDLPDAALRADVAVVSPGIAAGGPLVGRVQAGEIVGELGFAARFLDPGVPLVAITGTNGKSTVTSFTAQLLSPGRRVFAGGNLGRALSEAVGQRWDAVVVEVSSYQLELPGALAPAAAAVLNVTPDHLARHGTVEAYADVKCRIFERLPPDGVAAIPVGDPLLARLAGGRGGRRAWLGALPGVVVEGGAAVLDGGRVDLAGLPVPGAINRWNAAVACLLASAAGAPIDALDVSALEGLPHRMEVVPTGDGLTWINDSKATNVEATLAGLAGLDRPAVVLLGGFPKPGSRYDELAAPLRAVARAVICFGQAGPAIREALPGLDCELVGSLADACERARELACPGDSVLLSPACSSFDAFRSFEHRGDVFRHLARGEEVP